MSKKFENLYFLFIFLLSSALVFLSRQFQINYIKKNESIFYVFNEPVFINPDAYSYFSIIKKKLLEPSLTIYSYFNDEFLVSLYLVLTNVFHKINLIELALISTPYTVILVFFSIYLFFSFLSNKYLAILTSLIFSLSNIFLTRSSALYFDTDIFNVFFLFIILFILNFFFKKNLNRKQFYTISITLVLVNVLFIFHYPKAIFSKIFLIILGIIFLIERRNVKDNFIVFIFFLLSIVYFYSGNIISSSLSKYNTYSTSQIVDLDSLISVSDTVMELKTYSITDIEKFLFLKEFNGLLILISLIGILVYLYFNKKKIILFLPFIFFSYLTITSGIRFLLFAAPFLYFGLIFFFFFIFERINKKISKKISIFYKVVPLILIFFVWNFYFVSCSKYFVNCTLKNKIEPYFNVKLIKGLIKFNQIDNDYNIISSLDYGYLIDYYTNSEFELNPGMAFNKKKYKFFYSDLNIDQNLKNLPVNFRDKNENDNFVFLTYDFIDWWPTISQMYTKKNEKISQILKFSCNNNSKSELFCSSNEGLETKINLETGYIDKSKLIYKVIINSRNNYSEKIIDYNGKAIAVYTPSLEFNNLYVIFPKEFENYFFIKYFFSKINNEKIQLVDDGWPIYRTYKIK